MVLPRYRNVWCLGCKMNCLHFYQFFRDCDGRGVGIDVFFSLGIFLTPYRYRSPAKRVVIMTKTHVRMIRLTVDLC